MKSLSCYKGYRAFYEVGETKKVYGVGYLDGFEFEKAFTFVALNEEEAIYEFRKVVDRLPYSRSNPYPDLVRNPFGDTTKLLKPLPKE